MDTHSAADTVAKPAQPSSSGLPPARRPWSPPRLEPLPRLTDLTLQSGLGVPGSGYPGGGGSTVF